MPKQRVEIARIKKRYYRYKFFKSLVPKEASGKNTFTSNLQIYYDEIWKTSYVTTSNTKEIKSSAPNSIGHAVWSQGSHHNEFLQGAFPFPVLWKLLLLWTPRLYHLLPAFRRALNVPIKTTKLISEAHHLGKDSRY